MIPWKDIIPLKYVIRELLLKKKESEIVFTIPQPNK